MKKLLIILTLFATLGISLGKTIYVNANYATNGDGTSWSSPYTNLQTAVTASVAGDLVLVTNGVYSPISTGDKAVTIRSVEGYANIIIDGGGTGVFLNSVIANNIAGTAGGGMYTGSATNCTIVGNSVLGSSSVGGVYYPETIDLTTTITNTTHYLSVRPYATNDVIVTCWLYREP